MPSAIAAARVSGLDELSEWIALSAAKGADRFELWSKVRGTEQQRAHVAVQTEPFEIADELLTCVERDGRTGAGWAAYAVFAYRGKEKTPSERAFVSAPPSAMIPVGLHATTPSAFAAGGAEPTMGPSLALTTVLETMHRMIQDVFATLQRENAHQRSLNEAMMRASTGHFDALAKSYERAFGDMKGRHDEALREANEHRAKRRSAEDDLASIADKYKEILDVKTSETVEAERRSKVTSFAAEQLKVLLPVILAKIAGAPVDGEAIGGAAAGQLIDSLTEAQKAVILGALRPEQKIALCEMFQARAQRDPTAKKNGVPASPMAAGDVSASSSAHTPSPTQAPSPTAPANSPSAVASPAASPGASFTPEEERDFERIMQWTESPKHQARYEAWLEHKFGQAQAIDAPKAPESPNAPTVDTNVASMPAKT
jgi:hypothetical protein